MSGTILRLWPRNTQSFAGATGATSNPTLTAYLIKAINVSQYTSAALLVRLHTGTTISSGSTVTVNVLHEAPTEDDPSADFFYTTTVVGPLCQRDVRHRPPAV